MSESIRAALTSWRTTVIGLLFAIAASVELLLRLSGVESDAIPPATVPDWLRIGLESLTSLGFISSRDTKVSSEKAGAE